MSLMLPLALVETDTRCGAVWELTRAGIPGTNDFNAAAGHIDSRLICRPNSEWLNTDDIQIDSDAYAEWE
jgi:hypothetical protein